MKLRIHGGELGESDVYIDVEVGTYNLDGRVNLTEDTQTNPREWTIPANNLHDLDDKDLLVSHDDLPNPSGAVWDTIKQVKSHANEQAQANAESELKQLSKEMFIALARGRKGKA